MGLRAAEFASASSSPGWTLLLALCDMVFGTRLLTPIAISLLRMFGAVYVAEVGLRWFAPEAPPWLRYISCPVLDQMDNNLLKLHS